MPTTFLRFEEVTAYITGARKLFRSSAPGYAAVNHDAPQNITPGDLELLAAHGIKRIVSHNKESYTPAALQSLAGAGIAYLHIPIVDFTSPTIEDIRRVVTFWTKAPVTNMLVHCGYGEGRTGTMITGLQLWITNGHLGLKKTMADNKIEMDSQRLVLRSYQEELMKKSEL